MVSAGEEMVLLLVLVPGILWLLLMDAAVVGVSGDEVVTEVTAGKVGLLMGGMVVVMPS